MAKKAMESKNTSAKHVKDNLLATMDYVAGYHSNKDNKIRHLMVRGKGIRNIAEVEKISRGKVLAVLEKCNYKLIPKYIHYDCLEVDEF